LPALIVPVVSESLSTECFEDGLLSVCSRLMATSFTRQTTPRHRRCWASDQHRWPSPPVLAGWPAFCRRAAHRPGASGLAVKVGIPEFVISATVVAVGTSVPELATTITAQIRGHHEIGLGNILGSNIFNGLFIIGLAAIICPVSAAGQQVTVSLAAGILTTAMTFPSRQGFIGRSRGVLLLAIYLAWWRTQLMKRGKTAGWRNRDQ
jgi:Ca2+/Na+ antiporter